MYKNVAAVNGYCHTQYKSRENRLHLSDFRLGDTTSGVDVMIIIFGDFLSSFGEKNGVFSQKPMF
jgi:hypothetical protein